MKVTPIMVVDKALIRMRPQMSIRYDSHAVTYPDGTQREFKDAAEAWREYEAAKKGIVA